MQFAKHLDKSLWATADKLSFAVYGIVFTLFIVRELSAIEYAGFVLIYQSLFMLMVALTTGFSFQPTYKYAAETEALKPILSAGILLLVIVMIIFILICMAIGPYFEQWFNTPGLNQLITYIPFLILTFFVRLFIQYLLQSKYALKNIFIINALFMISSTIWLILMIISKTLHSAEQVLFILCVTSGGSTLLSIWYGRSFIKLIGRTDWATFKKLFVFGSYGIANTTSFFVFGYLDNYMIAYFTSPEQVTLYGVVKIFCRIFDLFSQVAQTLLIPVVSKLYIKKDYLSLRIIFEKAVGFSMIAMLPVAVLFLFFGQPLFYICFGGKYYDGIILLQVFTVLAFTAPWSAVIGCYYVGMDRLKVALIINIAYMVINIILYIGLIPLWGALGAVIATVSSIFLVNFIHLAILKKWIQYELKGVFSRYRDLFQFIKTIKNNV